MLFRRQCFCNRVYMYMAHGNKKIGNQLKREDANEIIPVMTFANIDWIDEEV